MPEFLATAPTSVLAFATTLHLGMAALRNHRSPGAPVSSLALVSALLSASAWLWSSYAGLLTGMGAHVLWYGVCERFTPRPTSPASPSAGLQTPVRAIAGSSTLPSTRPVKPRGFIELPVLAVFEETADIRTFRFARPDGFDFAAGQFLPIRIRTDGRDLIRCYSISSAPQSAGYLEVSVKRQGLVSGVLHATLRPGAAVAAKAPAGSFTYPAGDDRPLLLVAGGIGITPVLSMLRHATHAEPTRHVTLLYSARTEADLAFRRELELVAARHPQVSVVFAVTRAAAATNVYPGRIDDDLVRATVANPAGTVALMCGPQKMIDGIRSMLGSLGMPADAIRSELFEAVVAATGGADAHPADQATRSGTSHEVRCVRSGTAVVAAAGQTLLEAAESGGVAIDSICRAGVCGTCRTRVIDGSVHCDSTLLDDADRQDGFVLACVSRIQGDCAIEA